MTHAPTPQKKAALNFWLALAILIALAIGALTAYQMISPNDKQTTNDNSTTIEDHDPIPPVTTGNSIWNKDIEESLNNRNATIPPTTIKPKKPAEQILQSINPDDDVDAPTQRPPDDIAI